MIDIEDVIKEVAKNTGVDRNEVSRVCKHVFNCVIKIMQDSDDTRDILLNWLLKFKLKRRYKENKQLKYCSK